MLGLLPGDGGLKNDVGPLVFVPLGVCVVADDGSGSRSPARRRGRGERGVVDLEQLVHLVVIGRHLDGDHFVGVFLHAVDDSIAAADVLGDVLRKAYSP